MYKPNVIYKLKDITEVMEIDLKGWVDDNIDGKLTSALKKIFSRGNDVKVVVRITVSKVADGYDGDFKMEYDGIVLNYSRNGFEILEDLVNHAFDNFKQRILAK